MLKERHNGTNHHSPESNGDFVLEPNTLVIEDQSLRYGFIQLPKQILYARNLSHSAKLLYSVLLGYAWQEQSCFPGYSRLEEDMQSGRKMIRRYMRELEELGLISQKRRGQGKTNIYILHDLRKVRLVLPESLIGQNDPSRTAQKDHLKGSKEPPNNKQSNNKKNDNNDVVVEQLRTFGISPTAANRFANNYPEEYITDKLSLAQWLVDQGSPLVRKNPAGWLKTAIEEDYQAPRDFETPSIRKAKSERQTKAAALAAEERQKAEQEFKLAQEEIQRRIRENHPPEPVGKNGLTTETAWALTLEKLQAQIPTASFETWLKRTMLVSVEGKTANVVVPNEMTAKWINDRMYQSLNRTFTEIIGQDVEFRFIPAAIPQLAAS